MCIRDRAVYCTFPALLDGVVHVRDKKAVDLGGSGRHLSTVPPPQLSSQCQEPLVGQEPLVASLFLVVRPGDPSSVLVFEWVAMHLVY